MQRAPAVAPAAGRAPTAAVRLLQQLQLFPAVFAPPLELLNVLGPGFGAQCVAVIDAAEALVAQLDLQVGTASPRLQNQMHCRQCIAWLLPVALQLVPSCTQGYATWGP